MITIEYVYSLLSSEKLYKIQAVKLLVVSRQSDNASAIFQLPLCTVSRKRDVPMETFRSSPFLRELGDNLEEECSFICTLPGRNLVNVQLGKP